jgi:excisionase family DNA binding protein
LVDAADDGWLSVQCAAHVLGGVPRTVYRLINDGQLPGYRIGRVVRVRSDDLERYLDAARIVPGSLDHLCGPPSSDSQSRLRPARSFGRVTASGQGCRDAVPLGRRGAIELHQLRCLEVPRPR